MMRVRCLAHDARVCPNCSKTVKIGGRTMDEVMAIALGFNRFERRLENRPGSKRKFDKARARKRGEDATA